MSAFGVYLFGLGQIGQGYDAHLGEQFVYTHARALTRDPAFRLLGAVDPSLELRESFSNRYGIPAFSSADDLPGPVDGAVIATPTQNHLQTLRTVLPLASKFILAEKPLGVSLAEAKSCVEAADQKGIPLFVNYIRRADPAVLAVKAQIDAGRFGPFHKGTLWYSKGLRNNASHFINLLQFWLGDVSTARALSKGREFFRDVEPDFHLQIAGGEVYGLAAREENFSHYKLELCFDGGVVNYLQGGERVEVWPAQPHSQLGGHRGLSAAPELIEHGMDRYQSHVFQALARHLGGGSPSGLDAKHAVATTAVVSAIESSREQQ